MSILHKTVDSLDLSTVTRIETCKKGDEFGVGPYKTIARCDGHVYWLNNGLQANIAPADEGDLMLRVMQHNIKSNIERLKAYQAAFSRF